MNTATSEHIRNFLLPKKKIVSIILISFFLISIFAFPAMAQAQTAAWKGVCVETAEDGEQVATIQGLQCLIANVFSVAITMLGLVGLVMFIYGAFLYMLAGTDSSKVETAKKTLTYVVVGVIVALSSFIILNLIANFTGVITITRFVIPSSVVKNEVHLPGAGR